MPRRRNLARYLGQADDGGKNGDASVESLRFPAWVPKLTEPTKQTADGTYLSLHDYNLLIARANTRNMASMFVSAGVGFLVGWGLVRMYGRR